MAPFYEEVLERVVPFHEWDEWIKTKMTSMKIIT